MQNIDGVAVTVALCLDEYPTNFAESFNGNALDILNESGQN
jgi:hypothetical protein